MAHRAIPPLSESDKARFWGKVEVRGPDECWEWKAFLNNDGYGHFHLGKHGNGMFRSPRVAFFLATGIDPAEMHVLHRCDNPPCCNPDHLSLGTDGDNSADRDKKKRRKPPSGSLNGFSKLTESDVLYIRSCGDSLRKTAKKFGLDYTTVSDIRRRKSWRHI